MIAVEPPGWQGARSGAHSPWVTDERRRQSGWIGRENERVIPSGARRLVVLIVLAGCGERGPRAIEPVVTPPAVQAIDAGVAAVAVAVADGGAAPSLAVTGAGGVPHLATIVGAAVARRGDAAVSLDAAGEARLWTALDGSAPPRRIGARGLREPRVERAGDAIVIGAVLPGGVGYLGLHHVSGAAAAEVTLDSIDGDVLAVVPLTDGSAAVVARADQAVELYGLDGERRARVELGRERLRALVATGPDAVVAVVRRADDRFVARTYQRRGYGLIAAADVLLPRAPIDGRPVAVAPDGTRLATFRVVGPPAAAPVPAGAPVPAAAKPRPMPDRVPAPPVAITVQVVDLATGADVTPTSLVDHVFDGAVQLGFSGVDRLHVNDGAGGVLTMALTGAGELTTEAGGGAGVLAVGDRVVVGAQAASLAVHRTGAATVFLAYRLISTRAVALSDDGRQLAVVGYEGLAAIETLDGSAPMRLLQLPTGRPMFIAFLDARRLLVVDEDHHVRVVDIATGGMVASVDVAPSGTVRRHPHAPWLFGVRDDGGLWALPLDPTAAARPLGKPIVIADGAAFMAVVDGPVDGPLVATLGSNRVRTYTAEDLLGSAKDKKKRVGVTVSPMVALPDEVGHFYSNNSGAKIEVTDLAGTLSSIMLPIAPDTVWPLPGGGVLASSGALGGFTAYGLDAKARWTLAIGGGIGGIASTADRGLLALQTQGGIALVDPASGDLRDSRCAWGFGAWPDASTDVPHSPFVLCR